MVPSRTWENCQPNSGSRRSISIWIGPPWLAEVTWTFSGTGVPVGVSRYCAPFIEMLVVVTSRVMICRLYCPDALLRARTTTK
jgi:hypothetical protein